MPGRDKKKYKRRNQLQQVWRTKRIKRIAKITKRVAKELIKKNLKQVVDIFSTEFYDDSKTDEELMKVLYEKYNEKVKNKEFSKEDSLWNLK